MSQQAIPGTIVEPKTIHSISQSDLNSKALNTAFLSTRISCETPIATELHSLKNTEVFKSILVAVEDLSKRTGMSADESAEKIVETFRKLDRLWTDYFIQDGINRLKKQ